MWIILAIASALCLGVYDIFKKLSLNGNNVLTVLFFNTLFGALLMSPIIVQCLMNGSIGLGDTVTGHFHILIKSFIVLSSWLFGYFGLKHLPITIAGPINATRPVMVLIGAMLIFGEQLNLMQWGGVILGIVMGIRYLWKHFHMTSLKEEKKLQTGIDIRETCTIEKNKKETNRWFSLLNPQEKIRKIYRKQVLKHKSQIIGDYNPENLEHMTAKECCNKMISDNKFSPDNLKMVYEKARYSAEEITPEDLKLVKTKF